MFLLANGSVASLEALVLVYIQKAFSVSLPDLPWNTFDTRDPVVAHCTESVHVITTRSKSKPATSVIGMFVHIHSPATVNAQGTGLIVKPANISGSSATDVVSSSTETMVLIKSTAVG